MTNVLVTGATGFIGSAVVSALSDCHFVVAPVRKQAFEGIDGVNYLVTLDLIALANNSKLLQKQEIIIHIAAKAHTVGVSLDEFRQVNTAATIQLACNAAASGVKRFIFLSSIGVNGISNIKPFSVTDKPAPVEDYAVSKLEAEFGLKQIAADTGMEVVIIRPPLVYGANAPGNFGKLTKLASKNLPLPFGFIHNKRSLVGIDNLVNLIGVCIDHPAAANQTFLVSDDHDVSTTELLETLTCAAGKEPRLWPFPPKLLELGLKTIGKGAIADRLLGNLQVDITHTKQTLGWKPPVSFEEGIRRCFATD